MKLPLKYLGLFLSLGMLASCDQKTADTASDNRNTAPSGGITVSGDLPVTIDDLKAASAAGDYSATDLLRLLDLAEKGDKEGQFQLGAHYRDGLRIKQNYVQAFEWLSKASEQGQPSAHFLLGVMYHHGEQVSPDHKKALDYYKKAYKGGYAPAKDMADALEAALKNSLRFR